MPWPVWRVWLSGKATLTEIERNWSYVDLMRANEVLDISDEIEAKAQEKAKKEAKR